MFSKKKSSSAGNDQPVLRGRAAAGSDTAALRKGPNNPLARRFRADSEPPTVDLAGPARFPAAQLGDEDPKTAPLQTDIAKLSRLISHDPGSGKFYIHPGTKDAPVLLQGEPVRAPTELRRGDTICVGPTEIRFGNNP
jgi:hypothetical protein